MTTACAGTWRPGSPSTPKVVATDTTIANRRREREGRIERDGVKGCSYALVGPGERARFTHETG